MGEPHADHVLVKGWRDSGTIEAVYGPYSRDRCEWIRSELLEYASNNWTVLPLSDFTEPEAQAS